MDTLIEKLRARDFNAHYFAGQEEFKEYLDQNIARDLKVAFGGSVTCDELGLYEFFEERSNPVNWHWRDQDVKDSEKAHLYFSSLNALSREPGLYFVDGNGNRLKNIMDDDKEIYIVCGTNKIVEDEAEAKRRIEEIAGPKNADRLGLDPEQISNYFLAIKANRTGNINVLIIEGDYGY